MDTSNGYNHEVDYIERLYGPAPEPDASEALAPIVKVAPPTGPKRAGYTTNKGRTRNKARARMAKTSRVRNRR